MAKKKKRERTKEVVERGVSTGADWVVVRGRLKRSPGNPGKIHNLFSVVAEKIPYEALNEVKANFKAKVESSKIGCEGVYLAHDSMGFARYGGRGNVFSRLRARKKLYPKQLVYFSFYIVKNKKHEREIETLLIRTAGPWLVINDRKRAAGIKRKKTKKKRKKPAEIKRGNLMDYEAGTLFYERQGKRAKRPS